ncbi:MAG: histidine phosphatase family protein [Actinomycetota bacterium]|jgi:probable phosphoglycerate mutase|nr:histidine phosphatase family protein [Actinomycetota bacterium]
MSSELIVVRHGESTWNRDHLFQGQADPPLTELGRTQAAELAARCRELDVHAVAASDLVRAFETATVVADALRLPSPARLPNLRERWSRTLTGLTQDEIEERYAGRLAAWRDGHSTDLPGDSEPYEPFAERVIDGLHAAAALGDRLLVVVHGGVFRVLARVCGSDLSTGVPHTAARAITVSSSGITDRGDPFALAPVRARTGMEDL